MKQKAKTIGILAVLFIVIVFHIGTTINNEKLPIFFHIIHGIIEIALIMSISIKTKIAIKVIFLIIGILLQIVLLINLIILKSNIITILIVQAIFTAINAGILYSIYKTKDEK